MKANISIGECIVRIVIAALFSALMGGLFQGPIALLGLAAIYPFVTGMGGWDPIYALLSKYTNEESPYNEHVEHTLTPAAPQILHKQNEISTAA